MVSVNPFQGRPTEFDSPARNAGVIVLDADLPTVTRGLWVGASGDLAVTMEGMPDGQSKVFPAVPAGTLLPFCVKKVWTTGTTIASPTTNIVPVW